jgi:hypothetical protein
MMSRGRRRARSTITVTYRRRLPRDARFMTFSSTPIATHRTQLDGVELLVGEQRCGGVLDRPHHRVPADPELPGHLRDRAAELPDLPGRLGPRTFGQHRPRQDVRMPFPPRPAAVPAAPLPLVPHQPGGLRPDREITDLDDVPAARDSPLPALPAGIEVADGLDEHVPLIEELEHAKHAQPGDPEQRHRRRRRR